MKKSLLKSALVLAVASAGISSAFAATTNSFDPNCNTGAGLVIGAQGGYADTNWNNLYGSDGVKDTGFAARGYVGYSFNQFFQLESGYTYLPTTRANFSDGSEALKISNYAVDLLGKLSVPVNNVFSVYAKAGMSYLHAETNYTPEFLPDDHSHNFGPAFGVGASYEVVPNLSIDGSWMRFGGHSKLGSDDSNFANGYTPSPDVFLLGLQYKFNMVS